uniref:ABC transmembrane type-1 domain-containing protein n=1 Tax=Macrostomum lignano TaxID=282301 RepID=A0A1I8HXE8_9PLAT
SSSPEQRASFPMRLTYWWAFPMMLTGWRRPLTAADMFDLGAANRVATSEARFDLLWLRERRRFADGQRRAATFANGVSAEPAGGATERSPLLAGANGASVPEAANLLDADRPHPSLTRVLARQFGPQLAAAYACKLVCDSLQFASPALIKHLVAFADDPAAPAWRGWLYAAAFFLSAALAAFFSQLMYFRSGVVAMRVRSLLTLAVYRKSLRLSCSARRATTLGQVVSLMAVDVQRIGDLLQTLWMAVSMPFLIAAAMALLWQELGPAVLGGLAVALLLVPANSALATAQKRLQVCPAALHYCRVQQLKLKDARLKLLGELLSGIRMVKLFGWEPAFRTRVEAVREVELANLKKSAYINCFTVFTFTCAPYLITLATFSVFTLASPGNLLTPAKAFTALALFNILRAPMNLLPMIISSIITAAVSMRRLGRFLAADEADLSHVIQTLPGADTAESAVLVTDGHFSWSAAGEAAFGLNHLNFSLRRGSLTAVVGRVGSGKSSLLAALTGEMPRLAGCVRLSGSTALVSQQAWIQNASLRQNIQFVSDWDPQRYRLVLEACALLPDIEALPGGDLTEIGEKIGLVMRLVIGLVMRLVIGLVIGLVMGLVIGLVMELVMGLEIRLVMRLVIGLVMRLVIGLVIGLVMGLVIGLVMELVKGLEIGLVMKLVIGLVMRLVIGLVMELVMGLVMRLVIGLVMRLVIGLVMELVMGLVMRLVIGLVMRLVIGLVMRLGINLSGGQKQRVSLARAVYHNADIYLLDDPLSAVDSHVGRHIFERVLGPQGLLAGRTRLLVTNGLHWLPQTDRILVLDGRTVSEEGGYQELLAWNGPFAQFVRLHALEKEDSSSDDEADNAAGASSSSEPDAAVSQELPENAIRGRSRAGSSGSAQKSGKEGTERRPQPGGRHRLTGEERAETGRVKASVYWAYLRALSIGYAAAILALISLYQTASVLANVWLAVWSEDRLKPANGSDWDGAAGRRDVYLGVYGGIGVFQAGFGLGFALTLAAAFVRSSRRLHARMLARIVRAPMSFFDVTPAGRVLNRFSRDVEVVDNLLRQKVGVGVQNLGPALSQVFEFRPDIGSSSRCSSSGQILGPALSQVLEFRPDIGSSSESGVRVQVRAFLQSLFNVVATMVVISASTVWYLLVIVPLTCLYAGIQRFYLGSSRQLRRLESVSRSPIYSHFAETLAGDACVRAFGVGDRFEAECRRRVEANQAFFFALLAAGRWLGFHLEICGALAVLAAALFTVAGRGAISGGLVGLAISYALQVTSTLNLMIRTSSELETNLVSVERIEEYTRIAEEADWYVGQPPTEPPPPPDWPQHGAIEFQDFAPARGRVLIDGRDTGRLGLHWLRRRLSALPQDAVVFGGSLRENLDPLGEFRGDDARLWRALELAHQRDFAAALPAGLDHQCGEEGGGLSAGQRQLLCLARALLRRSSILVLDEATASVDLATDRLVQDTVRREFASATVVAIAHRISTDPRAGRRKMRDWPDRWPLPACILLCSGAACVAGLPLAFQIP